MAVASCSVQERFSCSDLVQILLPRTFGCLHCTIVLALLQALPLLCRRVISRLPQLCSLFGKHCNSCFRSFVDICWGKIKQRPAYPRTDGVHSMFGRGFSESNTEKIVLHKFFDHTGNYRYGRSTRKSCSLKVLESDLHGV